MGDALAEATLTTSRSWSAAKSFASQPTLLMRHVPRAKRAAWAPSPIDEASGAGECSTMFLHVAEPLCFALWNKAGPSWLRGLTS